MNSRSGIFEYPQPERHYPQEFVIKPSGEQTEILYEAFKAFNLDFSYVKELAKQRVPVGAEGLLCVPKRSRIAPTFLKALLIAHQKLAQTRPFKNQCWAGALAEDTIRLIQQTDYVLNLMEQKTPGDILVFPAQFGWRYRGCSINNVRQLVKGREFLAGPYEGAIGLLTHPDRIPSRVYLRNNFLELTCAGCKIFQDDTEDFSASPYYVWNDSEGTLMMSNVRMLDYPYVTAGPMTGFLPDFIEPR